ncbi:hypothetical protein Tco_1148321 [Tanacetum coccineum]
MSKEVGTPRYLSLVVPLKKVGDEADRMERAATTTSSLEANSGPRCQDTILGDVDAQTRFEITSKQSNDPPLSRGYTLGSWEDINAVKHMLMLSVQVPVAEVNPVIYTSCIEQFWATAKVQTVNRVHQLQALVDKKRVIITESSIRSDLHLDDAECTDCLPTATIFEELACMGAKSTAWNEFSSTMASLIICLATYQKFNLSKYIFDAMMKHLDGGVKFLIKEAEVPQDETKHEESVPTPSNDIQPSGEDSMQLKDLMVLCTKLQAQVLDLEKAKDAQAKEIAALKKRVQRLERKKKSKTIGLKRLKKDHDLMFDIRVLDTDENACEAKLIEKSHQSTKLDDSTASEAVTIASVEEPKRVRNIYKSHNHQFTKDKGKGIMIEPEVPLKRKDQVALDEQMARDVQAQLDAKLIEEEKLARKQEEETTSL